MKLLVVAAMPNELKALKEGIKSANIKANLNIDYLCCGIGNYEAISSLENYLTKNLESTFIWNIGICGYRNPINKSISDPIQVGNIINLHTEKESIIPPFLQIAPLRTCFSGENIIHEKPEFKKEISVVNNEMYFDMECRGIEFVASKYKIPRLILKVPFDFVGRNELNGNLSENKAKVSKLLVNLPYHDYLQKILNRINKQGKN